MSTYQSQQAEDARSELGGVFEHAAGVASVSVGKGSPGARSPGEVGEGKKPYGLGATTAKEGPLFGVPVSGVTRRSPLSSRQVGRGPVPEDSRLFRYDRNRARTMPMMSYGVSRSDRMDAVDAGNFLERVHEMYGIQRETEDVLAAFDKALFFEHTVNGASMLQSGRGCLYVGEASFDLTVVKRLLGVDQRRFFRAFADYIADVNREVLASYDAYDPVAAEKYGQLMQVAVERGLQKYPYLAHDSSDAGIRLSVEERTALLASKRLVLESVVNNVDKLPVRVDNSGRVD